MEKGEEGEVSVDKVVTLNRLPSFLKSQSALFYSHVGKKDNNVNNMKS